MSLFSFFKSKPARISLLHATRGRPEEPLKCRQLWFDMASKPDRVEHVFAIDDDDVIGKTALAEGLADAGAQEPCFGLAGIERHD